MAGGEGAADLLLIDDGTDRRAEKDHAAYIRDMDPLVEHVDAEEELEMSGSIRLEVRESPVGFRIFGIGGVDMRMRIHLIKPVRYPADHVTHVFGIGTEDKVLPCPVRHMSVENVLKALGKVKSAAKLLQDLFRGVAGGPAFRMAGAELVLREVIFVFEDREDIFGGRKDAADDGLAEGHLGGDMSVEELLGHVALTVKVTNICGSQAEDFCGWEKFEEAPDTPSPLLGARAVKLIQYNGKCPRKTEGRLMRKMSR